MSNEVECSYIQCPICKGMNAYNYNTCPACYEGYLYLSDDVEVKVENCVEFKPYNDYTGFIEMINEICRKEEEEKMDEYEQYYDKFR